YNHERMQCRVSFVFQAKDGIRGFHVTGVQTCALPISERAMQNAKETGQEISLQPMKPADRRVIHLFLKNYEDIETSSEGEEPDRSEERRVGKACRSVITPIALMFKHQTTMRHHT